MPSVFWRIIITVLVVAFVWLLVPLLLTLFGFTLPSPAFQIIKICAVGIAIWYIIWGPPVPPAFRN